MHQMDRSMALTASNLDEFDTLINQICLLFSKFDRSFEPPLTIMEVYAVIPSYSQLSAAAKEIEGDKELDNIILGAIKILKTTIKQMVDLQPSLGSLLDRRLTK